MNLTHLPSLYLFQESNTGVVEPKCCLQPFNSLVDGQKDKKMMNGEKRIFNVIFDHSTAWSMVKKTKQMMNGEKRIFNVIFDHSTVWSIVKKTKNIARGTTDPGY